LDAHSDLHIAQGDVVGLFLSYPCDVPQQIPKVCLGDLLNRDSISYEEVEQLFAGHRSIPPFRERLPSPPDPASDCAIERHTMDRDRRAVCRLPT
jgi:hypothetical protein